MQTAESVEPCIAYIVVVFPSI